MISFVRAAVVAAVLPAVFATSAVSAQTPADVTVRIETGDYLYKANNGGGGWTGTVTDIPAALQVPPSLVLYCFDNMRQFSYGTDMEYTLLSFSDFLNNAGVVGGGGLRANQWNSISVLDLNYMVEQVSGYIPGGPNGTNNTIQNNVWNTANNGATDASPANVDPNSYSDTWMILVDRVAWEAGLRDDNLFAGTQSFLAQIGGGGAVVPEPASLALVGFGLVALGINARRRRSA